MKLDTKSFHPLDRILDLRRSEHSQAIRSLIVELASRLSCRDVARVVGEMTGEPIAYLRVSKVVVESID